MDVDGVLVDGRPGDGASWSINLEEDLGISPEVLHRHFFQVYWEQIVNGRAPLRQPLARVLERIAPQVTLDRFIAYWFANDARIVLSVRQHLLTLRAMGLKVCLATNQEHERAHYLLQTLRLSECCDEMYYSAQLGIRKPNPEFFTHIAASMNLNPNELLLVDDTLANVQAAAALGWQTLHWTPGISPDAIDDALDRISG